MGAPPPTTTLRATSLQLTGSLPGPESSLPALSPMRALPGVDVPDADPAMAERVASGRLGSPLPYARHSDYTRADEPLELPALVLDNGMLAATVLPTLGGRVWSLYDACRGRELLFVNPRLRFANFGLTDGWFAGGIEWNLGSTGHWTLSSRPLHAARIATATGDGLRLWEWERTRDLILQVDLSLDGDRLLADTRVINPDPEPKPFYYWTNIAVPETPGTRVLTHAATAWRTDYGGRLSRVPVPHPDSPDVDISYPATASHAADYFFETEPPGRFVAAVEPDGRGFAQTGTDGLRGRKLFLWGSGAGGTRWQEWLSGPGDSARYAEIQAGWCTTQLEHDVIDGHVELSWSEAFGALDLDPGAVAAPFHQAALVAEEAVHDAIRPAELDAHHTMWREAVADAAPLEVLQVGSGWGAVEIALRDGAAHLPATALPFPAGQDERGLPGVSDRWQQQYSDPRWDEDSWVRYARGTNAHLRGDEDAADSEYAAAVDLAAAAGEPPPVGAVRGRALLAAARADHDAARRHYAAALALAPDDRLLLTEATTSLLDAGDPGAAVRLLDDAPAAVGDHGRHRLLRARALLALGERDQAAAILADLEVPDLAEGGRELTEIWLAVHPGEPIPAELDFRMHPE
jgi:tetratricopeptide (TPR) repeat protein